MRKNTSEIKMILSVIGDLLRGNVIIVGCPHPRLAAYILYLFSYFLALSSLYPSTFNENVFTSLFQSFFVVDSLANTMLFARVRATPIFLLVVM